MDDLETMRESFGEIARGTAGVMKGQSIAESVGLPNTASNSKHSSDIVLEYLKTSGSDAVPAILLETASVPLND